MPILPPLGSSSSTYSPQDAVNLVQKFAHGIPLDNIAAVCDMINSMMWLWYPWSWSINTLTPITCTDGVQDYPPLDTDVLRPLRVQLCRTDVSPKEWRELSLLANLSPELTRKGGLDTITSAGFLPSQGIIRLMYAASIGTGQVLQIQGLYQRKPLKITDANLTTPFVFPDYYFNVFVEGLKWKIYQLSDDPRAGTVQHSKNGTMMRNYSGQLGLFVDSVLTMSRTEDLQAGDQSAFPENPLGGGHNYWPGLFGL